MAHVGKVGLEFHQACTVDAEMLLATLAAVNRFRVQGFGQKWFVCFLSLRWTNSCEPIVDGVTFVELALAFVTLARFWLPREHGRMWN